VFDIDGASPGFALVGGGRSGANRSVVIKRPITSDPSLVFDTYLDLDDPLLEVVLWKELAFEELR
jgi:hypothetical protein